MQTFADRRRFNVVYRVCMRRFNGTYKLIKAGFGESKWELFTGGL